MNAFSSTATFFRAAAANSLHATQTSVGSVASVREKRTTRVLFRHEARHDRLALSSALQQPNAAKGSASSCPRTTLRRRLRWSSDVSIHARAHDSFPLPIREKHLIFLVGGNRNRGFGALP